MQSQRLTDVYVLICRTTNGPMFQTLMQPKVTRGMLPENIVAFALVKVAANMRDWLSHQNSLHPQRLLFNSQYQKSLSYIYYPSESVGTALQFAVWLSHLKQAEDEKALGRWEDLRPGEVAIPLNKLDGNFEVEWPQSA